MAPERDPTAGEARPACYREDCEAAADLWLFDPGDGPWRPICERHAVSLHPSIEVNAWLESGFARPVELDRPEGPPDAPRTPRSAAFRDLVAGAMGWSE